MSKVNSASIKPEQTASSLVPAPMEQPDVGLVSNDDLSVSFYRYRHLPTAYPFCEQRQLSGFQIHKQEAEVAGFWAPDEALQEEMRLQKEREERECDKENVGSASYLCIVISWRIFL